MASRATELVDYLVRSIVEDPDEVAVEEFDEDDELVLEIKVADDDLGRVIGREGRVAKAIRTIAREPFGPEWPSCIPTNAFVF